MTKIWEKIVTGPKKQLCKLLYCSGKLAEKFFNIIVAGIYIKY
jgi:hypothetical protein